jgi:hypothetical protein
MHGINVETLMGHGLGISDHYARPTDLDLLKDYLKAVDSLTISNKMVKLSEKQQVLESQMQSKDREIQALREQTQEMNRRLASVIEQQQQDANTFDMKFVKLLEIVKTGLDQKEILKMMPRKLTAKERQETEEFMENMRALPDDDGR